MKKSMQSALLILFIILAGIIGIRYMMKKNEKEARSQRVKIYKNDDVEVQMPVEADKIEDTIEEKKDGKTEINTATIYDLRGAGLSQKIAESIISYREKYKCIRDIKEIDNIKGIGEKSYSKIENSFYVSEKIVNNIPYVKFDINSSDEKEEYLLLGFTKKEYENIMKWKIEHGSIFSNIELLNIIGKERYDVMNERVKYSN